MKKVTHTNILCWAISHLNSEARTAIDRHEKAEEMGATEIADMLQREIDDFAATIETLKMMYEIETGKRF